MAEIDIDKMLQSEVEQVFGQKINDKYACVLLSTQIQKEISENISYQTIRRYWHLAILKNAISVQSKNILCRYAGFNDFISFTKHTKEKIKNNDATNWNIIKDWHTINPQDEPLENSIYWHNKLSQTFAQFILTNEFVFDSFTKAMHTNEVALKYIISYHPMYDNITKDWYLRGVNLFVRNAKELHYKLFEICLQFMQFAFTGNENELPFYVKQIETLLPKVRKKYGFVWPLEARAISSLLYFYKLQNDENKYNELKNECFELLAKNVNTTFEIDNKDIFIFLLSDYCNVYQMQEISIELQNKYSLKFNENALWRNGYNNATTITKTMTLFLNDKKTEAKKLFETIHIQNLNFDFKKYFSIQYQLLALGFCSKNANAKKDKIKRVINQLIDETGLIYFKNLITIFEK